MNSIERIRRYEAAEKGALEESSQDFSTYARRTIEMSARIGDNTVKYNSIYVSIL